MRIFVSEYVSSGAWLDGMPPASLAREGRAMLEVILTDFANIEGCQVITTWDARPGREANFSGRVEIVDVSSPEEERRAFHRLAGEVDTTFIIAPEFDGILAERCEIVEQIGRRLLGPVRSAVELCADKLSLAVHLEQHKIATIPTRGLSDFAVGNLQTWAFPMVVKRRDGAGSLEMKLVNSERQLKDSFASNHHTGEVSGAGHDLIGGFATDEDTGVASGTRRIVKLGGTMGLQEIDKQIVQPYVAGESLSVSAIVSPGQERIDVFPVGLQRLSRDSSFQYLGGRIPVPHVDTQHMRELVCRAIRSIPGLHGYVGFDLIQRCDDGDELIVCEINPRLTTSYLGYRALTDDNLADRLLFPERDWKPISWKAGSVSFTQEGLVEDVG